MTETSVRLYHPSRETDRLAIVTVRPASDGVRFLVQVALGPSRNALTNTRMFGPYELAEATAVFQTAVTKLRESGYGAGGTGALIEALRGKSAGKRAHAAESAGWRRDAGTLEVLLERAASPREDIASVLWALGRLGDARARDAARSEAGKKLLWRRRAGVEALLQLADADGLEAANKSALERLPGDVRARLEADADTSDVGAIVAAAITHKKELGASIDTLYELATPRSVAAARALLAAVDITRPGIWRYAKSVLKRALTRMDGATIGPLIHRIEQLSRATHGSTAELKSGLDGETRTVRVFSRKTVDYLRRLVWRWLTRVARYDGLRYAGLASDMVIAYRGVDDVVPKGRMPRTGQSYLLHRVLFGASTRYVWQWRKMRFLFHGTASVKAPSSAREEAFASAWDAAPEAFVRLLARASHALVLMFARRAVEQRHPRVFEAATADELQAIFAQDDEAIALMALPELRRRFDANQPDLALIVALLASDSARAAALGLAYLTDCAHVWTRDAEHAYAFLRVVSPAARETAARLFIASARSLSPAQRGALADRIVAQVMQPEPSEGAFLALAEAAEALAPEIAARVSPEMALALLTIGSDAAAIVARLGLAAYDEATSTVTRAQWMALVDAPQALVRRAALVAIERVQLPDLALVMTLAENEWLDVRESGARMLARLDATTFGLEQWMAILDATRVEMQAAARTLLTQHIAAVDIASVLTRLTQHPDREMRAFVVELALKFLPHDSVSLERVAPILRAVLFDVRPMRTLRTRVLTLLITRGLASEEAALIAARVLGDVLRSATHDVHERALRGLVELALAWPIVGMGIASSVKLIGGAP